MELYTSGRELRNLLKSLKKKRVRALGLFQRWDFFMKDINLSW